MVELDKPDTSKPAFKIFPDQAILVDQKKCPMCKKIIDFGEPNNFTSKFDPAKITSPFRNDLSRKEYTISGMCQDCQDAMFGMD